MELNKSNICSRNFNLKNKRLLTIQKYYVYILFLCPEQKIDQQGDWKYKNIKIKFKRWVTKAWKEKTNNTIDEGIAVSPDKHPIQGSFIFGEL